MRQAETDVGDLLDNIQNVADLRVGIVPVNASVDQHSQVEIAREIQEDLAFIQKAQNRSLQNRRLELQTVKSIRIRQGTERLSLRLRLAGRVGDHQRIGSLGRLARCLLDFPQQVPVLVRIRDALQSVCGDDFPLAKRRKVHREVRDHRENNPALDALGVSLGEQSGQVLAIR